MVAVDMTQMKSLQLCRNF